VHRRFLQRNNGNFCRAAANINNHVAGCLGDGQTGTYAAAIGSSIRYTSRAPADSADSLTARFSTWVMPDGTQMTMRGRTEGFTVVYLMNEVAQHLFGDVKVGDDTILHGTNGGNGAGSSPEHLLGFHADLKHLLLAVRQFLHSNNRWLTHHDPFPLQINQSIGGAESMASIGNIPNR